MSTVLVTGAARGIGLATARAFLGAGWRVLALDRDFSGCDEARFERVDFDLRRLPDIPALVARLGAIDTLVFITGHAIEPVFAREEQFTWIIRYFY